MAVKNMRQLSHNLELSFASRGVRLSEKASATALTSVGTRYCVELTYVRVINRARRYPTRTESYGGSIGERIHKKNRRSGRSDKNSSCASYVSLLHINRINYIHIYKRDLRINYQCRYVQPMFSIFCFLSRDKKCAQDS